jgi:hypothetical protein
MRQQSLVALALFVFTINPLAQNDVPTFKVTARSAFVWGEDSPDSAKSSVILDPLTGNSIYRLSHAGVEVSSRVGYERVSSSEAGKLLNYTTTVTNNTDSELSVQYGGASIDGRAALPLSIALNNKGFSRHDRKDVWELTRMYCFKTGFASSENLFSARASSQIFTVRPRNAMTVSSVTKDPRNSPLMCSVDGCHVTGTIRYYIRVNSRDYVFVWPGRSVVYCGK